MTSKGRYTALLDANVLYSATIRDIMMEVALAKLYRPKWTADIHREWIDAVQRSNQHVKPENLVRTRKLMDATIPTALVKGYERLIETLSLPDPNDRHVLAAAIVGRCHVIVTQNLKDFPEATMANNGVETQRPDEFLANHLDLAPGRFCMAIRIARLGHKNPPYTVETYLNNLTRIGLVVTATELWQYADLLD